jgi:hypothetical protein
MDAAIGLGHCFKLAVPATLAHSLSTEMDTLSTDKVKNIGTGKGVVVV